MGGWGNVGGGGDDHILLVAVTIETIYYWYRYWYWIGVYQNAKKHVPFQKNTYIAVLGEKYETNMKKNKIGKSNMDPPHPPIPPSFLLINKGK